MTIEDIFEPPTEGTIPPTAPPKTLHVDINALSDDDNISLESEDEAVTIEDVLEPDEVETRPPF